MVERKTEDGRSTRPELSGIPRMRVGCPVSLILVTALHSIVCLQPALAQGQLVRNFTPPGWEGDDVQWIRDVNPRNKIDDLIDGSGEDLFDVVVNFNRCVLDDDVAMLNALGQRTRVQLRLKYLSSVAVSGATKPDLERLIADSGDSIAFVERQFGFEASLDVSLPSICVTGTACANTVESNFPGIDGTGVNIVIMDSGVDDPGGPGTTHLAFNAAVFFYDAVTSTFVNPDDDFGHGTHVASIALGQATAGTSRGVAPGANLIDVRVFQASDTCGTTGIWSRVTDALQVVYDNRIIWGVDVINMSFGECNSLGLVVSDGLDAFSQLVDLAESMGIIVVAAAGNSGPANSGLTSPAAATRAITVAASDHRDTPDSADDTIAGFSSRGPRGDDGDLDQLDELKPEVTAPGNNLPRDDFIIDNDPIDADASALVGTTSPVAAGVGVTVNVSSSIDIAVGDDLGLYDLIMGSLVFREQVTVTTSGGAGGTSFTTTTTMAHPVNTIVFEPRGIVAAQFNTTNGSARLAGTSMAAPHVAGLAALIIQAKPGINAASVKDVIISTATPMGTPSLPMVDPVWSDRWGWGLVNGFEALNVVSATDLSFPSHPPSPGWLSPDISTSSPPQVGVPNMVHVEIRNNGPNMAEKARIHFGVHVFSASTPTFFDIGTQIVDIPSDPTGSTTVWMPWTPQAPSHQCLKVEIGYGPDTDYTNNTAQRNLRVATSPVEFTVRNTVTEETARINLVATLADHDAGWTYTLDPPFVEMGADDCPQTIQVELFPPAVGAQPGQRQRVHVAAMLVLPDGTTVELGGITVEDRFLPCEPCDMNCDGEINGFDIEVFLDLLFEGTDPCCGSRGDIGSSGDVNLDGVIDAFDIEPFLACLFP